MSGTTASGWLLHTLAGGGLLLLLAWTWAAWTRQPARRLRVAEWAVASSLLLAVLSLGPAWLVVTTSAAVAPAVASVPLADHNGSLRAAGEQTPIPPAPVFPPMNNIPPAPAPFVAPPPAAPAPVRRACRGGGGFPIVVGLGLQSHRVRGGRTVPRRGRGPARPLAAGLVALRRLMRRCEPVRGRAARLFAEMAGEGARPRLLASAHARAPFSCGLLRPAVVLPAGLCETAPDEVLRWVFAHELAHLRRRDAWSACCSAWGRRCISRCRGSGGCGARPGSVRSIWPTRPLRRPAAGPRTTRNSFSPGRRRPDRRSAPAASGDDLPIFFGG